MVSSHLTTDLTRPDRELKHFSQCDQPGDHSVVPRFWFVWLLMLMTNKCLVRPETSESRAGRGHTHRPHSPAAVSGDSGGGRCWLAGATGESQPGQCQSVLTETPEPADSVTP